MKKEDIHLWDVHRIFIGEAPASFLIEVFVRTALIYVLLLIAVRLMGKRMSGQLTIAEMAVMLTLGAIVSPAMQIPNVGLLQGILILFLALLFQRGLNWLELRSSKLEVLSHGKVVMLVKNGTLMLHEMHRVKMSRQQLFAVLRNEGIFNLGVVERVYLESFGMFSVYKYEEPRPGLSVLPPKEDLHIPRRKDISQLACTSCGHVEESAEEGNKCPVCDASSWLQATVSI